MNCCIHHCNPPHNRITNTRGYRNHEGWQNSIKVVLTEVNLNTKCSRVPAAAHSDARNRKDRPYQAPELKPNPARCYLDAFCESHTQRQNSSQPQLKVQGNALEQAVHVVALFKCLPTAKNTPPRLPYAPLIVRLNLHLKQVRKG